MSRLNAKLKNMKRDLILEKASEMFEKHGFTELKVSELAQEAGVSVGTIYSYFDSKEGVYSACVSLDIERACVLFEKLFEQDIPFEKMLEETVKIKFEIITQKRKSLESGVLNNPFFFESQQIEHKEAFDKIYGFYIEPIDKIKSVDIDSWQLVYILNSIGNAYILRWIEGELDSLEGKEKEVCSIFMSILKG
ncbi:MAG: TetR/AcrR family transcriptional regulator [Helicobacteraceae bacterium]|jgi:AcrR family transcriptional regulator|nr:TetR/AcrR family transcriptional regulator [Helicobacteraceae bacterium]